MFNGGLNKAGKECIVSICQAFGGSKPDGLRNDDGEIHLNYYDDQTNVDGIRLKPNSLGIFEPNVPRLDDKLELELLEPKQTISSAGVTLKKGGKVWDARILHKDWILFIAKG